MTRLAPAAAWHPLSPPAGASPGVAAWGTGYLATRSTPAPWRCRALREVEELLTLEADWDSYGAPTVSPVSAQIAARLIEKFAWVEDLTRPTVTATPRGTVGLCWDALDVEILPTGELDISGALDDLSVMESLNGQVDWRLIADWLTARH